VINSGGVKIQAADIEAGPMQHPQIRQAAVAGVVGVPDGGGAPRRSGSAPAQTSMPRRSCAGAANNLSSLP